MTKSSLPKKTPLHEEAALTTNNKLKHMKNDLQK